MSLGFLCKDNCLLKVLSFRINLKRAFLEHLDQPCCFIDKEAQQDAVTCLRSHSN